MTFMLDKCGRHYVSPEQNLASPLSRRRQEGGVSGERRRKLAQADLSDCLQHLCRYVVKLPDGGTNIYASFLES